MKENPASLPLVFSSKEETVAGMRYLVPVSFPISGAVSFYIPFRRNATKIGMRRRDRDIGKVCSLFFSGFGSRFQNT
jgi:hypothetical protein